MTPIDPEQADALLALAKSQSARNRRLLLENMTDLFLAPEARLAERDRALMADILGKLVDEVESEIRRALAERLAVLSWAPHELVLKLSQDEAKVARPLLLKSPVLRDADLIDLVKQRSQEHRLAIAMRAGIGTEVADALIAEGEPDVVEALIRNADAQLSRQAIDYLVEESRRIDRFQEPLLRRQDLPPKLAFRMFWWVSAALRQQIMAEFPVDTSDLDDVLEGAVHASAAAGAGQGSEAERLAAKLGQRGELNQQLLIRALRAGHVNAFIANLARMSGVDLGTARRIVFADGGEALAACCKAADFDRSSFATIYLLTRQARLATTPTPPAELEAALKLYDTTSREHARGVLRYWMRDADYLDAISGLAKIEPGVDTGVAP
jgi:uncharacterized protein (DUF2336 family)